MDSPRIMLVINPGSTSTKLAVYRDESRIHQQQISYTPEQLSQFPSIIDQISFREMDIRDFLDRIPAADRNFAAVVGRGGVIVPLKSGAYEVNELLLDRTMHRPEGLHASNLGAVLAWRIAQPMGIKAYTYDSVSVSEQGVLAVLTGCGGVLRMSRCHVLNMRAVAIRAAKNAGRRYDQMNIIVAHLGGGITLSVHRRGRIEDIVLDSEGPLSPERAGRVPLSTLITFCRKNNIDYNGIWNRTRGAGGMAALLGTNNAREAEERKNNGDKMAALVFQTIAYQTAKAIGELSTVVKGEVDLIILTGGMAYCKQLTEWITDRVFWLGPVLVMAGEDEMDALANGVLRALRGEEPVHIYDQETDAWTPEKQVEVLLESIG
jgi:butyrate kinase